REVERDARQRRDERELPKTLAPSRGLALLEDAPAEAAPRPVGAHEHRPHPRRFARGVEEPRVVARVAATGVELVASAPTAAGHGLAAALRSEEHTSELQSRVDIVCRLLLEKKKGGQRQQNAVAS